jgi:hypothetical protein
LAGGRSSLPPKFWRAQVQRRTLGLTRKRAAICPAPCSKECFPATKLLLLCVCVRVYLCPPLCILFKPHTHMLPFGFCPHSGFRRYPGKSHRSWSALSQGAGGAGSPPSSERDDARDQSRKLRLPRTVRDACNSLAQGVCVVFVCVRMCACVRVCMRHTVVKPAGGKWRSKSSKSKCFLIT